MHKFQLLPTRLSALANRIHGIVCINFQTLNVSLVYFLGVVVMQNGAIPSFVFIKWLDIESAVSIIEMFPTTYNAFVHVCHWKAIQLKSKFWYHSIFALDKIRTTQQIVWYWKNKRNNTALNSILIANGTEVFIILFSFSPNYMI